MHTLSTRERVGCAGIAAIGIGTLLLSTSTHPPEAEYTFAELVLHSLQLSLSADFAASSVIGRRTHFGIPTLYRGLKSLARTSYKALAPIFRNLVKRENEHVRQDYVQTHYNVRFGV